MTELNSIKIIFALMTFLMVFFGLLINTIEKYLPTFIVRSYRYGKFAIKGKDKNTKTIEVPKSWFKHFYVFASIISIITIYFVFGSYIFNKPVPLWLRKVVDILGARSKNRETAGASLLATFLLCVQCIRRFYDTQCVSVFSMKSKMNLAHYIVGYVHYLGAFLAILVEAPNFTLLTNKVYYFRFEDLFVKDVLATVVFLFACYKQYETTVILAKLRKNYTGTVVSEEHFMPSEGWFQYVSSPHLLAEMTMYVSLAVILSNNTTWRYVMFWVLSNQIETGLLTHWWYKETFPKYPATRKAVIPFIL